LTTAIQFGTSGWRAVIGDQFTFPGVRRAARAFAGHLRAGNPNPTLLVGYDTRFFSEEFARSAAHVLRAKGCQVLLCARATPTPALAYEILRRSADGAINITASHNPAEYNGVKISDSNGGPALPELTRDVEARAARVSDAPAESELDGATDEAPLFVSIDPCHPYLARIAELVRFDVIRSAGFPFVFDAIHGCGAGYLDAALSQHGVSVTSIRTNRDVLFEGSGPDPSEDHLGLLRETVREHHAVAGLATDGDADRFGILDRDGSFLQPGHLLALLFDYLFETRGLALGAARSVATSHLLDATARLHKVELHETPVGFKYIGALIEQGRILLGGEESAGMSIHGHVPEKDGILACLLTAEMISARRASLREQLQGLFRRVGAEYWPVRVNLPLSDDATAQLKQRLSDDFREFLGRRVASTDRTDGLKMAFEDGSWVLLRPSGTEPVVRIYTEASSVQVANKIASEASAWLNQ
jgi:phosphoglucomutase